MQKIQKNVKKKTNVTFNLPPGINTINKIFIYEYVCLNKNRVIFYMFLCSLFLVDKPWIFCSSTEIAIYQYFDNFLLYHLMSIP